MCSDLVIAANVPLPWDFESDVLTLKSFCSTHILKYGKKGEHLCTCGPGLQHRSLFDFNRTVLTGHISTYKEEKDFPKVHVCHNADNIWECKLPRPITGLSERYRFSELPTVKVALSTLFKGTYWYRRLAPANKHVLARLFAGFTRPNGPETHAEVISKRLISGAARKLNQVLATCDGVIMQVILAFPQVPWVQSWTFIDQIQNCLISNLLYDYFHNGSERTSLFKGIKDLRKSIKEEAFRTVGNYANISVPRELSFYKRILSLLSISNAMDLYKASILCQTRASGVPPRSMYADALQKVKVTLTTPASPEHAKAIMPLLHKVVDSTYNEVLLSTTHHNKMWERIVSSAKVSLSDSGEFFTKVKEGGKLEATRRILQENPKIQEVNLQTGDLTGAILTKDNSSPGEMLFHYSCGQFRDRSSCYEKNLMSMRISLVAELGKYRAITVTPIAHAAFLHPASHMCLEFLEKIPSSESGIGAAAHAWNFFKRMNVGNPNAQFIFSGTENLCLFSTDWSEATDHCDPYMSQVMLNRLFSKMGFPTWYRQTVMFALLGPRQVEFLDDEKVLDFFITQRGALMGDPVTKVLLHLYHLVARPLALKLLEEQSWSRTDSIVDGDPSTA